MKLFWKIAVCAAACALALACLAGCQSEQGSGQGTPQDIESEVSDSGATNAFYVLLVGNDSRTGTVDIAKPEWADGNARSDTMILARVDPDSYKVTLITIPRDTAATVDGSTKKINFAYQVGGIEDCVAQVEDLTGVEIDYYFDLGFVTFQKFVDALGGLSIDVPVDVDLKDIVGGEQVQVPAGSQDLDGVEALAVARARKVFAQDQDACRQIQDRALVAAAITKVAQNPDMVATAVSALMDNADTNMSSDELTELVAQFAEHADQAIIYQATGPYSGDIDPSTGEWLATRDEETWSKIISVADAGKDPSGIVPLPQVVQA